MSMIQRALWKAGMQSRHRVLGRQCLHVPPRLKKTHLLFSHTCRDLSSPQDKQAFFITVFVLYNAYNCALTKHSVKNTKQSK